MPQNVFDKIQHLLLIPKQNSSQLQIGRLTIIRMLRISSKYFTVKYQMDSHQEQKQGKGVH